MSLPGINQYLISWPRATRFARLNYFVDFNAPCENCTRVKLVMRMPLFSHRHSVYICRAKRHFDFRRKIVALCRGPRIKQILERADMKILEKGWNHGRISLRQRILPIPNTSADSQRKIRKLESKLFSISKSSISQEIFFTREQTTPSLDTIAYVSSGPLW